MGRWKEGVGRGNGSRRAPEPGEPGDPRLRAWCGRGVREWCARVVRESGAGEWCGRVVREVVRERGLEPLWELPAGT